MPKVHLDSDLGGDLDDLCALAMLLHWSPAIELTGITVVGDTNGRRTGMVHAALEIAGRDEIPVAAGADTSQGFYPYEFGLPPEERYWPRPILPRPNPPGEAVALLKQSIEAGATIIGIGPLTNFYLLDLEYPGLLQEANLFLMGGYIAPPRAGYPQWSYRDDFNLQVDVRSAKRVLQQATSPTLTPLTMTAETALRRAHLPALQSHGRALGQLIAKQAEEFAKDERMAEKYADCAQIPTDMINFQHDALACAVALGWRDGVTLEEFTLEIGEEVSGADRWLTMHPASNGRAFHIVTQVDGARFSDFWLAVMTGNAESRRA